MNLLSSVEVMTCTNVGAAHNVSTQDNHITTKTPQHTKCSFELCSSFVVKMSCASYSSDLSLQCTSSVVNTGCMSLLQKQVNVRQSHVEPINVTFVG